MLRISEIRDKEVINLYNGQRMGYIKDFEVDLDKGWAKLKTLKLI